MLCFLLAILSLSAEKIPKYSIMMVSTMFDDSMIDDMNKKTNENLGKLNELCEKLTDDDAKNQCLNNLKEMQGYYYASPTSVNKILSQVSKKTEYLFFTGMRMGDTVVDFNNLKSSMSVFFFNIGFSYSSQNAEENANKIILKIIKKISKVSFDGSHKSALRLAKSFDNKERKKIAVNSYITLPNSKLVGNIGSKVPFLMISGQNVIFTEKPCDCENLLLLTSTLDTKSENVKSKYLLLDLYSHNEMAKTSSKLDVDQYTLYLIDADVSVKRNYRISYESDKWSLYQSASHDFTKEMTNLPYTRAKSFSIIVISLYIDINLADENIKTFKAVNITVQDWQIRNSLPLPGYQESKNTIKVVETGNWDKVTKDNRPGITVTTDDSKFEINDDECTNLQVETAQAYTLKPKKKGTNVGLIVGVVVAVVVVIAIVVVVVIIVLRKKKNAQDQSSNEGKNNDEA